MVRPIVHDTFILARKSTPATQADRQAVEDLLDTLRANLHCCAGMAANMIGVHRRIIAVAMPPLCFAMINPVIVRREGPYQAEEGCLSLAGTRPATRYQTIEVEYLDRQFRPQRQTFSDFPAQVIQHEIDHCDGILI